MAPRKSECSSEVYESDDYVVDILDCNGGVFGAELVVFVGSE
jgi:hypothetical protein